MKSFNEKTKKLYTELTKECRSVVQTALNKLPPEIEALRVGIQDEETKYSQSSVGCVQSVEFKYKEEWKECYLMEEIVNLDLFRKLDDINHFVRVHTNLLSKCDREWGRTTEKTEKAIWEVLDELVKQKKVELSSIAQIAVDGGYRVQRGDMSEFEVICLVDENILSRMNEEELDEFIESELRIKDFSKLRHQ